MKDGPILIDNALPETLSVRLLQFGESVSLLYGSRSNSETDPHGHWMKDFVSAGKHNLADVAGVLSSRDDYGPLYEAWEILKKRLSIESVLIRCYLNGYTFGTDGYFHTDSSRTTDLTVIAYLNREWRPDWAGETVFLDDDGEITRAILPKRNRVVVLPGNLMHAARAVSRQCSTLRRALIFKTRAQESLIYERLSSFLVTHGARSVGHRAGTLHDHLVRTFSLLTDHGCSQTTCFAGGLHSVFGTNKFKHRIIGHADEELVVREFGSDVQQLITLFGSLQRPETLDHPLRTEGDSVTLKLNDGGAVTLSKSQYEALALVECANLLDQGGLARYVGLQRLWYYSHPRMLYPNPISNLPVP